MKLTVKYKSQFDADAKKAKGDCMETCLAMVVNYVLGMNLTTDRVVELAGPNLMRTTIPELKLAAKRIGLPLNSCYNGNIERVKGWLNEGKPVIAIINYEKIKGRQDRNYTGGHSVVIIGVENNKYIVNDPDHWGGRRHSDTISKAEFESAWYSTSGKNISRNGSAFVPVKGKPQPKPKPKVKLYQMGKGIFDPKGDLIPNTAEIRKRYGANYKVEKIPDVCKGIKQKLKECMKQLKIETGLRGGFLKESVKLREDLRLKVKEVRLLDGKLEQLTVELREEKKQAGGVERRMAETLIARDKRIKEFELLVRGLTGEATIGRLVVQLVSQVILKAKDCLNRNLKPRSGEKG